MNLHVPKDRRVRASRYTRLSDAGIKKEHLDTTPGEFVDNETIEIDDKNTVADSNNALD